MRQFCFLLLWVIIANSIFAIDDPVLPLLSDTTIPESYFVDFQTEYEKNLGHVIDEEKHYAENYAQELAYQKAWYLNSDYIYFDQPEFEKYLNKVVEKLIPASITKHYDFKMYLKRSPNFNASAYHDGTMFCNIGLLNYVDTEAEMAYILAHEIAHVIHEDVKNRYLRISKNEYKAAVCMAFGLVMGNKGLLAYSRDQELAADSLGFILHQNAGYSSEGTYEVLNTMLGNQMFFQGRILKKKYKTPKNKQRTHPVAEDRIAQIQRLQKLDQTQGSDFIVDQTAFNKLKEFAALEAYDYLDDHNLNYEALEIAFKRYLLSGNDRDAYLALKNARKFVYENPYSRKRGLLEQHFGHLELNSKKKNILTDLSFLFSNKVTHDQIVDENLRNPNKLPFKNNIEFIDYMGKRLVDKGHTEALLEMALFNYSESRPYKSLLKTYTDRVDAKYPKYAASLLKNSKIELKRGEKKLIYLVDVEFEQGHQWGTQIDRRKTIEKRYYFKEFVEEFAKKKRFDHVEMRILSDEYKTNLGRTSMFENMMDHGDRNLAIYDPDYWVFSHQQDFRSVTFIHANTTDRLFKKWRLVWWLPYLNFMKAIEFYRNLLLGDPFIGARYEAQIRTSDLVLSDQGDFKFKDIRPKIHIFKMSDQRMGKKLFKASRKPYKVNYKKRKRQRKRYLRYYKTPIPEH